MTARAAPPDAGEVAAGFRSRLDAFRRGFERDLAGFLDRKRSAAAGGEAASLVDALAELAQGGGKRLRPALVHHAHRAFGGDATQAERRLALSVELLHTYLLIHDDIMDHADVRRGRPAAHVRFGERHRRGGWAGDPADFGRSMAILLGDLAHTWAAESYTAGRAAAPAGAHREALDGAFAAMCEEVIVGQYEEMLLPHRESPREEDLLLVLRLKSGRYSVERPLQLGALLAGGPPEAVRALRAYGASLGEAFQLQDDVLGTFGAAESVGKPVGSDLREGKRTFLVHHALAGAAEPERARLRSLLGRADLGPAEVGEARAIIERSGGLAAVRRMIEERLERAGDALDRLHLERDAHSFFEGLIAYSRERDR